jgi:hypothetical protein
MKTRSSVVGGLMAGSDFGAYGVPHSGQIPVSGKPVRRNAHCTQERS